MKESLGPPTMVRETPVSRFKPAVIPKRSEGPLKPSERSLGLRPRDDTASATQLWCLMKFGWLTLAMSPSPDEDCPRIDQIIEQACAAERMGFSDVWLTEHYFTGESVYNDSLMFAAALAMKTEQIRIGFAVVQMPFHHPVRLAVQLALFDNLSKGRIDVGIGKGTVYNEYEFVGHGLRSTDSRERMEEAVDIIERAWREAPLTYDGKFHKVHIPAIRPKPVQQPGPPLWRSVISPGSFTECGRLGVPILTARLPVERIKERWATYAAGIDAGGHDEAHAGAAAGAERAVAQRLCGRVRRPGRGRAGGAARRDAHPHDACARGLQSGRLPARAGDAQRLDRSQGPAIPKRSRSCSQTGSLYGSPARVREQVAELRDVGVRHLLCQTGFGAMSHEQNLASMRRFGEQVMPAFGD